MSGRTWERVIALENQELFNTGRAMLARVPTHYHGGVPSRDPKVDFVGLLNGGRMVALEAKADSGTLSKMQRRYLATVARFGGVPLVYRWVDDEKHLCLVDEDGNMQRKSSRTLIEDGAAWLDAWEARQ